MAWEKNGETRFSGGDARNLDYVVIENGSVTKAQLLRKREMEDYKGMQRAYEGLIEKIYETKKKGNEEIRKKLKISG
ncbi:hypothetical protein HYV50_02370 [Candidatus Pacearchaeota archaeon]|nr:hypothetical protein [Candidatus Pacearchaeota archaeon]